MKKNLIWVFAAILTCGLAISSCAKVDSPTPSDIPDEPVATNDWEYDFAALVAKYENKTAITISEAVSGNLGTCSIVNGVLADGKGNASEDIDSRFALQTGTNWILYTTGGIYSMNGGTRAFGILKCLKGQTISISCNEEPKLTSTNAEKVSGAEDVYTYNVTEDGDVTFTISRYKSIFKVSVKTNK